jgi:hypothetical protein
LLKKKPKVDFAGKIAAATPQSLPQESTAKKPKSDAQDANLKGKIKSIIEYSQDPGKVRVISGEEYYDEHGDLIREVGYDDGYPTSVAVWGYIDGERVIKAGGVEYTTGERPAPKRTEIVMRAEDNALHPEAPRDNRYSTKYKYIYDVQGRLTEKAIYQNNGDIWLHTTYSYKGNQREQRDYDARGNEMSRTVYVLDKNGDTAEEWMFGADENDVTKEFYTHVLDSKGNWIEEKVSERKKARGKTVTKPLWTTYRTITYYP